MLGAMKAKSKTTVSLPCQVAQRLRREIAADCQPGEQLPGMHTLRQRFGVSINTIGAALDILAGEGVVVKRRGSGVYVSEQRQRIGILSELDIFDARISPYFRAVAGELKRHLTAKGAEPRLYLGNAEPGIKEDAPTCPQFWTDIDSGMLDGAVILDTPATKAWRKRITACAIPVVGSQTNYLADIDLQQVVKVAVQRLKQQGCQRLGLLAWRTRDVFIQAVNDNGLETRDAWIRTDIDPALRGAGWDEFREIWLDCAQRPDGLVVLDDMLFNDAQLAILQLGISIPSDLQLAVLTNRDMSPPLRLPAIVLEIDPRDIATGLADMLLSRLRGENLAEQTRLIPFREVRCQAECQEEKRRVEP